MRSRLIFAAVALLVLLAAGTAQAGHHRVYLTQCSDTPYKPTGIALSCADNYLHFEVNEWTRWDEQAALGSGTLSYPICAPHVALAGCHRFAYDPASIKLYRPVRCNHRYYMWTRLLVVDPHAHNKQPKRVKNTYACPRRVPARWRKCGSQRHRGAGWYYVRALRIHCAKARAVARSYSRTFGGRPYGFTCERHRAGIESANVYCHRFKNGRLQRVRFLVGA